MGPKSISQPRSAGASESYALFWSPSRAQRGASINQHLFMKKPEPAFSHFERVLIDSASLLIQHFSHQPTHKIQKWINRHPRWKEINCQRRAFAPTAPRALMMPIAGAPARVYLCSHFGAGKPTACAQISLREPEKKQIEPASTFCRPAELWFSIGPGAYLHSPREEQFRMVRASVSVWAH